MIEEKLVSVLKNRMTEIAVSMCEYPVDDLAKYNRQVGLYLGNQEALIALMELLNDDTDK